MELILRRKNRSRRNLPCWTICSRLQLVALMIRRLTLRSLTEPTRRMVLSSSSLSSFACSPRSISPISPRNRVPPSAASTRPIRRSLASVNAPFSCPKSSASSRCMGIEAQLNSMKGGICARPAEVQCPSHQFLAGTRFTLDQHRRQHTVAHAPLRFLQLQDEVLDLSHRRGLADHQLKTALAGFALLIEGQLTFHALRLPALVEQQQQLGKHHRLGQIMESTRLHRGDGIFDIAVSGHH